MSQEKSAEGGNKIKEKSPTKSRSRLKADQKIKVFRQSKKKGKSQKSDEVERFNAETRIKLKNFKAKYSILKEKEY